MPHLYGNSPPGEIASAPSPLELAQQHSFQLVEMSLKIRDYFESRYGHQRPLST